MRVLSELSFVQYHQQFAARLRHYQAGGWAARESASNVTAVLTERSADRLLSMNPHARIAVMRAGVPHVAKAVAGLRRGQVAMLTVGRLKDIRKPEVASQFDFASLIAWLRSLLIGFDYLGFIEAGYYSNWVKTGAAVSWHAHVLLWAANGLRSLEEIRDDVNRSEKPAVHGPETAHIRWLGEKGGISRWRYMSKAPMWDTRVWPNKDGAGHQQRSRPLRPGEAVKVCASVGEVSMAELIFGGGNGARLPKTILRDARRAIRQAAAEKDNKLDLMLG